MTAILKNYNLNKYCIGCFSTCEQTDMQLRAKKLNIFHYQDGRLHILSENAAFDVVPQTAEFFEDLHDFDVLQVFSGGLVRLQCSEYSEENTLFVTSACNSNCVMCPSADNSRRLGEIPQAAELIELVRHYPKNVDHITITGGEPFLLRDEIFPVLEQLKAEHNETEYLVLTNGRIFCLDRYVQQLTQTAPRYTTLAIPIHGSTAEKHDAITRVNGSFAQTVSGISKLLAAHIPIELRIVVSKLNADDIVATAKMIAALFPTVTNVNFIGLEMLGNAAVNSSEVWLPYRTAFEKCRQAADILIANEINTGFYNFPLCAVDPAYWAICQKSISDYKRSFPAPCEHCSKNHICGGVFAGSLRFALQDMKPFEDRA
ncbi:MAG: His-Xaa-Ser system radical SAM maturase HxsC [Oscillospiraceae bacterium]|nr:His-Xaa-Ser system radical SAM maturase HxsC [Oscillospiraceae bacterium]